MRGVTNAVPSGGGLKIVASGTKHGVGGFRLESPAAMVIICQEGADYAVNQIVLIPNNTYFGTDSYYAKLSVDGLTITINGETSVFNYFALA